MNLLRYVLVAATLFSLASLLYLGATEPPDRVGQTIVANGRARICPELGLSHPLSTSLRTLVSLWLDAKERELRDRAGKS